MKQSYFFSVYLIGWLINCLVIAVMNGQLEIVRYLEKNDANFIVYDGFGNSLLDLGI